MAEALHILVAEARFYDDIADELMLGACAVLDEAGATYETVALPGAFEIPAAFKMAMASGRFDGYIALGCVIRGETSHYDYVCGESARGLMSLATRHGIAIGYGILTTENREQAWTRASRAEKNKGAFAAETCLRMARLRRDFSQKAG
ncbi:MAG: 6,7-dimethyl-8-ribityllumazine synthase [Rhodospirillaceae bacterium]|jgi:6,7-dimethyl-8-ribityllumazine synthase|nr:6,7-dimethyl-8-ribityllumazine synthase [Rhodospirillaceae bacterium]MBT5039819.1 6,7-dimethyl-8-ribityllumazine synthase [Rhodospirillaceae bacterium]MBT5675719.1 6,7-dimethyl-8-ribityllumazine synthase [Rhodospirillaceae bacterium]MBT5778748.1 6,7-dimethyl-8-ribityllumazine synthase [Rhodospirillaceae bacterium]MBT6829921.1 6,7-dimethyl-8-ribityllumazine synthase [Rhodospirillaceae bacterium]